MGIFNKKENVYKKPSDATVAQAFKYGDTMTKLSFFICGLGNLVNKQFVRGIVFLGVEIAFFVYMATFGINAMGDFVTLGTEVQGEVYNEITGLYEYTDGDNSMLCMLYGVITMFVCAVMVFFACMSGKSAYATQFRKENGMKVPTFKDDLHSIKEENMHTAMLALPIVGILVFT
ncbi:MAG: sugar ABC transporter permease, partial [Lachnospiraceae bacterium]|nr:sugar ABC transporter permease [Lachnospiraceae bacterium]